MPHAITGSARKRPLFINLIGATALALAVSLATPGLAQDNRAGDPTPAPPEGPAGAADATIPRLVTFSGIVDPQMMQLNQSPAGSTGKARLRLNGAADFLPLPGAAGRQEQDNHRDTDASRIKVGFKIAPVPLNLDGKDPDLVGLGSYWVNAVSDCNFCHTAGGPPNYNFAAGFNPYFAQPKKTDPTTYLAGGTDFGPALPLGFYVTTLWELCRSRHYLPQPDARQNRDARRGTHVRAIQANLSDRRRPGPPPSDLYNTFPGSHPGKLHSTSGRRKSPPGHALAELSGHDGP